MVAICVTSLSMPMLGNVIFALCVDRMRALLTTPAVIRTLNLVAGFALVLVGLVIAFA